MTTTAPEPHDRPRQHVGPEGPLDVHAGDRSQGPAPDAAPTPMWRERVPRFITLTAALGSFTDWTLFAGLVVAVDRASAGSAWATSLVLAAKIIPAIAFAPLAARRADRATLRATLLTHEVVRVAATVAVGVAALAGAVVPALLGLIAFEYAAAMQAATRESVISRHVDARHFTSLNTITAVLGYGLLPVGAAAAALLGPAPTFAAATIGYSVLALSYAGLRLDRRGTRPTAAPRPADDPARNHPGDHAGDHAGDHPGTPPAAERLHDDESDDRTTDGRTTDGRTTDDRTTDGRTTDLGDDADAWPRDLRKAVAAAALGVVPPVMLFTIAPRLADAWTGDPAATGALLGPVFAGAALGFFAANRGRSAALGLLAAAAGLAVAAAGPWPIGLGLVGFGAGLGYLQLQTRLQHLATAPSQFATAFAVLKAATIVATLAGPALYGAVGPTVTLQAGAAVTAGAAVLIAGFRAPLRAVLARIVRLAVRIDVRGVRHEGPTVVVSNHPNALDGVVALAADLSLRPIARWQRNPLARAGIWIGECVVTTAGTDRDHRPAYLDAAEHLVRGGRIWLAPEGGAHPFAALRAPRSGAVRMAHTAGVPIQALGVTYDDLAGPRLRDWRPWRRPRVVLTWGDVVSTSGIIADDNDVMMRAIAAASGTRWAPERVAA